MHKPGLTNLAALYDKMSGFVDKRGVLDIIFLKFFKALDNVSCSILVLSLGLYSLNVWATRWVKI